MRWLMSLVPKKTYLFDDSMVDLHIHQKPGFPNSQDKWCTKTTDITFYKLFLNFDLLAWSINMMAKSVFAELLNAKMSLRAVES